MTNPFVPGPGAVLSADIAVPEHERELRFYARVLSTGVQPLWREDLMNSQGIPVIGLGAQTPEYARLPLQWMPHIQVADVGASVARALDSGGSALMHERDADGASQWAVLLDPNGAAFGLIPVVPASAEPASPAEAEKTPAGRIAWLDLTVPAAAATRDFYRDVVGWTIHEIAMEDAGETYADYAMLGEDGTPKAGICHLRGINLGLPPVWMLYLPVGDLAESLRRVETEGGRVLKVQSGEDGQPLYAAIQDPLGAYVALMPA